MTPAPPPPDLVNDLARQFTGELRFDALARALYATDASIYQIAPLGVAFPRTAADLQAAVQVCAQHGVPVISRGGGSGLAGGAVGRGLVLDCSRHLTSLDLNVEEGWAWAAAGVVCDALTQAARPHGLDYGCAPSSSDRATVGGMVACNATGAHSLCYGLTSDQLLAADVILADGRAVTLAPDQAPADLAAGVGAIVAAHADAIRAAYPHTWRSVSGYRLNDLLAPHGFSATRPAGWGDRPYPDAGPGHLHRLLAGSEGTLAVIARAKLRLVPRPACTGLSLLQFESIRQAADATRAVLETGPAAVELLDQRLIDVTRAAPGYAHLLGWVVGRPAAVLAVEYTGANAAEVVAQIAALEARRLAPASTRALSAEDQAAVWGVRKAGLGLLMSVRGDAKPAAFMEDVSAPVERLGELIGEIERIFAAEAVTGAAFYGHASAGCLHIRPLLNLKQAADVARMRRIAGAVCAAVRRLGGAMSGEHGDGLARSAWNAELFGPAVYAALGAVKDLFDPRGLLNPGKIVAAPALTEHLRYGPRYQARTLATMLDFSREGGFAGAVEQCNGAGACRQAGGAMCPSFQATRDEEHSTRGRANALRAALSGALPPEALTSARLHAVLDLCLECKACKAECPSAVDMAKLKYEFLAHYQAQHGVPLRSRLFGQIALVSRLAQPAAGLVNALLAAPAARWLGERLLGIAAQRPLPKFARRTFRAQFEPRAGGRPVVLFDDTYTQYQAPEVGLAAVRVLRAAGYEPVLAPKVCCGRPLISKGLLAEARVHARRNVAVLAPFAQRGMPIVGLEPSCLLTLRDEYLDFLPGDPDAQAVARQALLLEEFVDRAAERYRPLLAGGLAGRTLAVHGHCYQKALTGLGPLLRALRLTGADVRAIDAGCCGLAGAFGYEAEHYAVSMRIGEDRLLPAVRAAAPETVIIAAGISCRSQIAAGAGRLAQHPAQSLAQSLGPEPAALYSPNARL
ncbi:MAG: FAD-binding protein [Anaerolineales bacterium]|nr:FAD-binding protein [Anaerolineales bacterium]